MGNVLVISLYLKKIQTSEQEIIRRKLAKLESSG